MQMPNPKNFLFPIVVSVRDYFSPVILSDLPPQRRGGCGGGGEGYSSTPEVPINCLSYQIDVAQYHLHPRAVLI